MLINLIFATPAPADFIRDMNTAAALLDAAIFNPITVNIAVSYGVGVPDQNTSLGGFLPAGLLPYAAVYPLLYVHDPASVSALPFATTVDGRAFFTISTAQAKAFGLIEPNFPVIDGSVEIGTNFTAGAQRIETGLHELTHAMGRLASDGIFDLFRFSAPGTRVYDTNNSPTSSNPAPAAYFSVDGGQTKLADFGTTSDPGDFLNPPDSLLTPDDPFNETVGSATPNLTHVDLQMMDDLGFLDDLSAPFEPQSTLPVSIGGTATITTEFLSSTDPDNTAAELTYTVLEPPAHGSILLNGTAATSFTQADIDNHLVQYRENGDAASSDSFTFRVADPAGNRVGPEPYTIAIVTTTAPVIAANATLSAPVAAPAIIWKDSLSTVALGNEPAQMRYTVLELPAHGTILVNGTAATSFTQADIDNHLVQYRENGDAASSDSFTFQVSDAAGDQTATTTFNIAIQLVPIAQLCADILGRAPGPSEFAYLTSALANGARLQDLRSGLAASAEAQNHLRQLYNQIFGGAPDPSSLADWTSALANGASLQEVRSALLTSAQNALPRLYRQIVGGAPDPSSLADWTSALAHGVSLQEVRRAFANTKAQAGRAQLSNRVFGRAPDAGGLVSPVLSVPNAGAGLTAATHPEAFDFTSLTFGHDSIAGFDPTRDAIRLSSGLVNSFATVPADMSAVSGATLITLSRSASPTLDGVAPASLSAANFRFV